MRYLGLAFITLSALSGCGTKDCRPGTVLLSVTVSGDALRADTLQVDVTVNGVGSHTSTVPLGGKSNGTVQIDFPKYPVGAQATVLVTALVGSTILGSATTAKTLLPGCDVLKLSIGSGASILNDMQLPLDDQGTPSQDSGQDLSGDASGSLSVSIVAGQLGGTGNADGVGPTARFYGSNITYGQVGSEPALFVADKKSQTIRRIIISTGAVATIAGIPNVIGSADGSGTSATFDAPYGIAYASGILYVSDGGNDTIRKINVSSGQVSTLAGSAGIAGGTDGMGSAARFNGPGGLAYDGLNNYLYVADTYNHTIRRITLPTGAVSAIAGTAGLKGSADGVGAAARFAYPEGILLDYTTRDLFVADSSNSTIRSLNATSFAVTTLAGAAGNSDNVDGTGSAARFGQPLQLATDFNRHILVADQSVGLIRVVGMDDGVVTTLAGSVPGSELDGTGSKAAFDDPQGITSDGAGHIYIVDSHAGTIRAIVQSSGVVSTFAGTAVHSGTTDGTAQTALLDGPSAIAADSQSVYVSDATTYTIRKIVRTTGAVSTFLGTPNVHGSADGTGSGASFLGIGGIALDGLGNMFVTDSGNHTVRKIVLSSALVTTIAGSAGATGTTDGIGVAARFSALGGIVADASGNLYIADTGNKTVRKMVVSSGAVTTIAGTPGTSGNSDGIGTAAQFAGPSGLALDPTNTTLYIIDELNQDLRKLVLATGIVTTIAGSPGLTGSADGVGSTVRFNYPTAATFVAPDSLFITDLQNDTIRKLTVSTGAVSTFAGVSQRSGVKTGALPAGLNLPFGIAASPDGQMFVSDPLENVVLSIH